MIQEYTCVCLTIRDEPASSSRDEHVKLKGRSRMRPRVQFGHPTCQKHITLSYNVSALHILLYEYCWLIKKATTDDNTLSKTSQKRTLVVRYKYRFLLRARSSPETPLRCAPPPRGGATLLTESTAADGCLKNTRKYSTVNM